MSEEIYEFYETPDATMFLMIMRYNWTVDELAYLPLKLSEDKDNPENA